VSVEPDDSEEGTVIGEFVEMMENEADDMMDVNEELSEELGAMAGESREPSIVKEGWLMKRGEVIKNWRPRYFVLKTDGQLLGYKSKPINIAEPGEPCNNFTVKDCQTMMSESPKPCGFALRGLYMDTIVERIFHTESDTDRSDWIKNIETVRNDLQGGSSSVLPAIAAINYDQELQKRVTMEDFELLKVLGRGAFGKVVLCREKTTRTMYAMKILKKSVVFQKNEVDHTLTENRVLQTIRHPFIVGLKYSFTTEDRLCFVTEYVSGGELFVHLKNEKSRRFSEDRTRFYSAEIVCALGYLHKRGIIYRDIKLENLLLDKNGHIKMVDFGLCKDEIFGNKMTNTFCGTPSYLPPEVVCNMKYGRAVDWWGLGVVIYELLTGHLPFYAEERKMMFRLIVTEKIRYPKHISAESREIISKLMTKNPDRRLGSLNDADEVMEQSFFADINWTDLQKKRITPPFKPVLSDELDTRYVDPEFENDDISLTPPSCSRAVKAGQSDALCFSEFSYRNSGSLKSSTSLLSGSSRSLEIAV